MAIAFSNKFLVIAGIQIEPIFAPTSTNVVRLFELLIIDLTFSILSKTSEPLINISFDIVSCA